MIKTFSFRIKDSTCAKHLEAMARATNSVWNFCNETQRAAIKWGKKWPTGFDLNNLTAGSSRELGLHSQTVQAIGEEYARRREQHHKRWLRWRGRRSLGWIPFKKSGIRIKGDSVSYCGHRFRFWKSREIEGVIKSGSFNQDARGRWYVNVTCLLPEPTPTTGTGQVGIDLGLKDFATFSTGERVAAERRYRELEDKLGQAQRRGKKRQVKTIHARIKNRRKDFLHKLSTRRVEENELIVIGNVSAFRLAKTRMAKSVLDAGWSMFRTLLSYKAIARKVVFAEINEAYTTRTCSQCGARGGPQGREGLGVREWVCSACGAVHDRDVNAALNILRLGHQSLRSEVA